MQPAQSSSIADRTGARMVRRGAVGKRSDAVKQRGGRSGTESSHDSSLEGTGFEILVRGHCEPGCHPLCATHGSLGRIGAGANNKI